MKSIITMITKVIIKSTITMIIRITKIVLIIKIH